MCGRVYMCACACVRCACGAVHQDFNGYEWPNKRRMLKKKGNQKNGRRGKIEKRVGFLGPFCFSLGFVFVNYFSFSNNCKEK